MEENINHSLVVIICFFSSLEGEGFFFASKKDDSVHPCIHYQSLNSITVKNKYPLPLLISTFTLFHEATIFTKLDLWNAYYLVRTCKRDNWKTAINTHLGHFEYLVITFGLTNTPVLFQALLNDVLQILQCLLENELFLKAEKCQYHAHKIA